MNGKPATPLTPTPRDLAGHFRMITAKESPGLVSLQLRCPPFSLPGRQQGRAQLSTLYPPSPILLYLRGSSAERSGGPRSALILGRGVHSHPTAESKGQEAGR